METSNESSSKATIEKEEEEKRVLKKEEKDIDKVTDYHQETESLSHNTNSLLSLEESSMSRLAKQAAITVSPLDILAISEECEFSKEQAEALLRRHGGDIRLALQSYVRNAKCV